MVPIDVAETIIDRIAALLVFRPDAPWEVRTFKAALRHLATANPAEQGQVVLLVRRNRELPRVRTDRRYQTAVDSKVEVDAVAAASQHAPALLLYRQNGATEHGWKGSSFWWPLIRTPRIARAVVFASEEQA